jgi:hypothetical protein
LDLSATTRCQPFVTGHISLIALLGRDIGANQKMPDAPKAGDDDSPGQDPAWSSAHQEAIAMREAPGERAVLLGGGMAGLLAARVLSDFYREVLIVDRDELNGVAGYRRGVPHGRHAHGLVARGHLILEQLFPRITQEMTEAGVEPGDFNGCTRRIPA